MSPPNLRVLCLYGRVLLVIELMFSYGLATTLDVIVRCNTAIISESIRCALIACGVKYVCLLATTLNVIVHCNIAIRSLFVRCTLMTYGHVFVYCSATTLVIDVCCDKPSDWSPPAACWLLSDFYPFVVLVWDKVWSWPLDRSPTLMTCNYWFIPRLLPFRCFQLRGV